MLSRILKTQIEKSLLTNSAVAILGPRQVGKTTLALEISKQRNSVYLDLESPQDLAKLQDPISYFSMQKGKLIILDEIQHTPELFKVLRGFIDKERQTGNNSCLFLILGSASNKLLKQSAESLAGRIRYIYLSGFSIFETNNKRFNSLWLRGGFPQSYLAIDDTISFEWREDFIKAYLERDIPKFMNIFPASTLHRLWIMLSHLQGTIINFSKLSSALDVSNVTVKRYIDFFCDLLLIRRLEPLYINVKKRLIKSPKFYVRDSGILHQLLGIKNFENLLSNPIIGQSFEGFVIENIFSCIPQSTRAYFYRTSAGAEIDLILEFQNNELWAIEIKRTSTPKVSKGFYNACQDLSPSKSFIVYNGKESFPLPKGIMAVSISDIMKKLKTLNN